MLAATWVLARAQLIILRNTLWRAPLGAKLGNLAVAALAVLGASGAYGFTRLAVAALGSPELAELLREAAPANPGLPADPAPLLAALPAVALFGALTLLVFSSFGSLLSALFLARDLDALLVAPVPMRAVFVVKFFGGLSVQYLILLVLLGPALLAYGHGMGYGPLYQLSAALALLLSPLLPAGLAALLVMVVVRVMPPRRAREIVGVLGGLLAFGFSALTQIGAVLAPRSADPDALATLLAADNPLLPSSWAGRALIAAGEGRLPQLALYGGGFLAASIAVFAACLVAAEQLYYAGWSGLANDGGRVRRRRTAGLWRFARPAGPLGALLPAQSAAILAKDLRLFTRDLRNLQALIFPLALSAIWVVQLVTGPTRPPDPDLPAWAAELRDLGGAGIVFFICVSVSGALAGGGVSREGKAYWLLKLAPVSPWRLLLGKLALAFLPFPLLGAPLLIGLGLARGLGPATLIQQAALIMLCGLGSAAIGVGLGAAFPRLNWEHPGQQTSWQSGCLSAIGYPLFLLAVIALVAGGSVASQLLGGGARGAALQLLGWALAAALTAAVVWLSALVGARGLERIEL
jgi:ABC-2 type transport system permease protein